MTDTTGGLTIDGYSQPGASPNTDPVDRQRRDHDPDHLVGCQQLPGQPDQPEHATASSSRRNNLIRGLAMYNLHRSIVFETIECDGNA